MVNNITHSKTLVNQMENQLNNQKKEQEIYELAYAVRQIDSFLNWIEKNKTTLKEDRTVGRTLEKKWEERNQLDYRLLWLEEDNGNKRVYRQRRFPLGTNRLSPEEYLAPGDESITFETAQEAVEFSDFAVMKDTFRKAYLARINELKSELEAEKWHNSVNQISAQIKLLLDDNLMEDPYAEIARAHGFRNGIRF